MDCAWTRFTSSVFPCAVSEVCTGKVTFVVFSSSLENNFSCLDTAVDAFSSNDTSGFSLEWIGAIICLNGVFLTGCELNLFKFDTVRTLRYGNFVFSWHISTSFDDIKIVGISSYVFEEALFDVLEVLGLFYLFLPLSIRWILTFLSSWCFSRGFSGKFLGNFEIFFSSSFSLKNLLHRLFFFCRSVYQWFAELQDVDRTFGITDSSHVLVYRNRSKGTITDLLTECDLILSIIEVPDIEETVDSSKEEKTTSGWRPATVGKIGGVISCLHNGWLLLFTPDLGAPITDREEVLSVSWVSIERVNWSMMFTRFKTESLLNFDSLSLICLQNITLLCTNEIL